LSEFSLIDKYFKRRNRTTRSGVTLGIDDDAALVSCPSGYELVIATDTLVAGVHFPATIDAADIGYKAVAVNLSDLAAMGAEPAWILLNLTLPEFDDIWLTKFSHGLFELVDEFGMTLTGGDTCRGPLNIVVTAAGWAPAHQALRRSGAQPGDDVFVSGTLGDAAMGLRIYRNEYEAGISELNKTYFMSRLNRPTPRVTLGQRLREIANACIDVSDGLYADAGHIAEQSDVGMEIYLENLPVSAAFKACSLQTADPELAVSGGDDYELCFTVPPRHSDKIQTIAQELELSLTKIGRVTGHTGVRFFDAHKDQWAPTKSAYDHFA
jgi:thiamine-monophosphate kinase